MQDLELDLFLRVRRFSRWAVVITIVLSFIFSQFIESSDITWQVIVALLALAIGIPHGALDHLVTLPRTSILKMALFITLYIAVAIAAVMAILYWNVAGFIVVVVMSALHFGVGDAAYISEIDRRKGTPGSSLKFTYASAAGTIPVVIPLVSSKSTAALEKVNSELINWHQGLASELFLFVLLLGGYSLLRLLQKRRYSDVIDLALLALLAVVAPPLVAFAVYFGCWHAMRHTARLTLALPSSQLAFEDGKAGRAFFRAVIPGTPALVGTLIIAVVIIIARGDQINDQLLWILLVVVWALTVPHMAVTARLDRKALS